MSAAVNGFPHEGGCPECRAARICNVCGVDISHDSGRCTNGRCSRCHTMVCVNTPGLFQRESRHAYGVHGAPHFHKEAA